jgi:hypothetical protein
MARAAWILLRLLALMGLIACSYRIKPDGATNDNRFTTPDQTEKATTTPPPPAENSSANTDPNMEGGGAVAAADSPRESQKTRVRRVILSRRLDIRACYNHAFGVEQHRGVLVYEWEYNERGRVVSVRLVSTDFNHPRFEKCIEHVISQMRFPSSPGREVNLRIRYPFEFR